MSRVPATPEDQDILRRNIARIMKMVDDTKSPADDHMRMLKVLRAATGDYLHFAPEDRLRK